MCDLLASVVKPEWSEALLTWVWKSALKHPCVNLISGRTFESGNHEVILADCLSKYEVGNLDTKSLGSAQEYHVLKHLLWYCLIK